MHSAMCHSWFPFAKTEVKVHSYPIRCTSDPGIHLLMLVVAVVKVNLHSVRHVSDVVTIDCLIHQDRRRNPFPCIEAHIKLGSHFLKHDLRPSSLQHTTSSSHSGNT